MIVKQYDYGEPNLNDISFDCARESWNASHQYVASPNLTEPYSFQPGCSKLIYKKSLKIGPGFTNITKILP